MEYLNLIYFAIIVFMYIAFLQSDGKILKSPYNNSDKLLLTGPEMYWCFIFSTGSLAISFDAGIDLMAVRLLIIMSLCIIGLQWTTGKPILSFPLVIYLIYLGWLVIGCLYTPDVSYGIRTILKYLYPLIICLFASAVVDNFTVTLKSALLLRWGGVITLVLGCFPFIDIIAPGVIWYVTARIIGYIPIMIFSLALVFFSREKWQNIGYTLLFLLPCFFYVLRTSILGSIVAIIGFSIIKWRLKSLPIILSIVLLGIIGFFAIPSLRSKMFYDSKTSIEQLRKGELNMDHVNTNYRAYMWKNLENHLFVNNKVVGSGTGAVQEYMYNNPKKFAGLKVPHSDLVQMKCDNGLIGLSLYSLMIIAIFIHCVIIYYQTQDNRLKLMAITAAASLVGIFACFYSDNTVNYSMTTLALPFGFYGMTLALNKRLL